MPTNSYGLGLWVAINKNSQNEAILPEGGAYITFTFDRNTEGSSRIQYTAGGTIYIPTPNGLGFGYKLA